MSKIRLGIKLIAGIVLLWVFVVVGFKEYRHYTYLQYRKNIPKYIAKCLESKKQKVPEDFKVIERGSDVGTSTSITMAELEARVASIRILEYFAVKGTLPDSLNDLGIEIERERLGLAKFVYVKETDQDFLLCGIGEKGDFDGRILPHTIAGRYSVLALNRDMQIESYIKDFAGFGQVP